MTRKSSNYIVVSPVKDEESVVEATIQSVLAQTLLPSCWVIVDDGSRDQTLRIVNRYAETHPWITVLKTDRGIDRQPGPGVIHAFAAGYRLIQNTDFDFIVKLDMDLRFGPDYFEQLLAKFHEDERLGIASGVYLENRNGKWVAIKMPEYHAAGACKVVRAECFRDIGGFVPSRGWDTVDEIKAQSAGWKTRYFPELEFYHLKKEGSGIGLLRTAFMDGEIDYSCGVGGLFFALKVLHRIILGDPVLLEGLMMFLGHLNSYLKRKPRLLTGTEARLYRNLLNERIRNTLQGSMRRLLNPDKE